jgi:hypothetical protein
MKKIILLAALAEVALSYPAWAWFAEGHEIVAVMAADDLTPSARSHVAQILGVPADKDSGRKGEGTGIYSARHRVSRGRQDDAAMAFHRSLPSGQGNGHTDAGTTGNCFNPVSSERADKDRAARDNSCPQRE